MAAIDSKPTDPEATLNCLKIVLTIAAKSPHVLQEHLHMFQSAQRLVAQVLARPSLSAECRSLALTLSSLVNPSPQ